MSMARISDWLRGTVRAELVGAFPAGILNALAGRGVELWDVESADGCTLRLTLYESGLPELEALAQRAGCEMRVLNRVGGTGGRRRVLRRPALLIGLLAAALLLLTSSLFVWDVEVRGTKRLSRAQVLRVLEDCGLGVGSFWPGVNTELLRSDVMLKLPEIGWMTVNVCGSRAAAVIVEREEKPEMAGEEKPAELVASHGGLVRRVNVLEGSPRVKEGRLVAEGEVLVGAELPNLVNAPRLVRARGAVMADTWYELTALRPLREALKSPHGVPHSRFALVFGKKRVNLFVGSGKALDGCDKILQEYTLGIPGLFSTPIRLVRERFVPYKLTGGTDWDASELGRRLYALLENRTEGQILSYSLTPGRTGELYALTLRAHCLENIAISRTIPD